MADFPASLPAPEVGSASFDPWPNVIRTQMDAGAPKVRRRFTAVGANVKYVLTGLTREQVETLEAFVANTVKDVLPFNWKDWRLPGAPAAVYRFRSRPKYSDLGRGDLWRAELDLEMLP